MSGLPREVLKWVQSLNLTWPIKNPKWDLTNGYLVAEIFSWYHPHEIHMHMFNSGHSFQDKYANWKLLKKFFKVQKYSIPDDYADGTLHCKEGAAVVLLESIYTLLTNRAVRKVAPEVEMDFTDRAYQEKLPLHCRNTASRSIQTNLKLSEFLESGSLLLAQQKAQAIVENHIEARRRERDLYPEKFDRQPTLGELATRKSEESQPTEQEIETHDDCKQTNPADTDENCPTFKRIQVRQMDMENHHEPMAIQSN